jgi:hypothetical protein
LTFFQPTPDFSLGQCGIDRQDLIDLSLCKGCPSERLAHGDLGQRVAEILDEHEILLSNQPLRRNPEQPPEAQRSIGVQEPMEQLTNSPHPGYPSLGASQNAVISQPSLSNLHPGRKRL